MNPHSLSNAAGLIVTPFFLISVMQLARWLYGWLAGCLSGWLT